MRIHFAIGAIVLLQLGGFGGPDVATKESASAAPPASNNPDQALERRLAEIDSRIAQVKTLKADFEQIKTSPLLKRPLLSTGTIAVKGARVKWKTESPRKSVMTFAAGEIRMFYPEERVVEIYTLPGKFRELSANPLGQLSLLRSMFRVSQIDAGILEAPTNDERYLALELSPDAAALEDHVSIIRALVDTKVPCLTRLDVFDADGACTTIKLRNVQVNIDVKDEDVDTKIPAGTRESRPFPSPSEEKSNSDENKGPGK